MDEGGRAIKSRLGYEKILRAIGHYCDQHRLDEVCLMEFDKGVVLQGFQVESTGEGYRRQITTHTLSYEQISDIVKKIGR